MDDVLPDTKKAKGKYKHYKGNQYEFVSFARDADTLARLVVYKPLYETPEFGEILWVRPEEEFFSLVIGNSRQYSVLQQKL